jgi:NADH:ubiquinone oxidoreductase subunit B-like Fe-S oxidoreductase
METAQAIIGLACLNFELASTTADGSDLSRFFIVAWATHSHQILVEVGYVIPEPKEPSIVSELPLFL